MKLVELLARELSEWPEKASHAVQHEDGDVWFTYDGKPGRDKYHSKWSINALTASRKAYWLIGAATNISTTASDHATAIVTRFDWSADRARIAKPAKNAEGWIRHRAGRKCPVEEGVRVDYRMRSKREAYGERAELLDWGLDNECPASDIMAYRLHKPAEQVEACSKPDPRNSAKRDSDYVCWMRDRITEIDATTQALTTERAELVQKLASEGFALIGRINDLLTEAAQKHEDMSDWLNWKVGDLVECISHDNDQRWSSKFEIGSINKITEVYRGDDSDLTVNIGYYVNPADFKFHSRPSA